MVSLGTLYSESALIHEGWVFPSLIQNILSALDVVMIAVGPLAAVHELPLLPSCGFQYPCRHFIAARYLHIIYKDHVGWGVGVITVRANIIKIQMIAQIVIFKKQIPVRNTASHVFAIGQDVRHLAEF